MTRRSPEQPDKGAADRLARQGAALRANLQRRKAQARSRADGDLDATTEGTAGDRKAGLNPAGNNNDPAAGVERPARPDESEG